MIISSLVQRQLDVYFKRSLRIIELCGIRQCEGICIPLSAKYRTTVRVGAHHVGLILVSEEDLGLQKLTGFDALRSSMTTKEDARGKWYFLGTMTDVATCWIILQSGDTYQFADCSLPLELATIQSTLLYRNIPIDVR